jgi:hypothetical protein
MRRRVWRKELPFTGTDGGERETSHQEEEPAMVYGPSSIVVSEMIFV